MECRHEARILIAAPQQTVWDILSDLESWPDWTPTMQSIRADRDATAGVGSRFIVKQPGFPAARFVIDTWEEGAAFTWSSNGLGTRTTAHHVLEDADNGCTNLTLVLEMTGPLARAIWSVAKRKIRRFVDTEADSLRLASESSQR